jgi:hypothetical protein
MNTMASIINPTSPVTPADPSMPIGLDAEMTALLKQCWSKWTTVDVMEHLLNCGIEKGPIVIRAFFAENVPALREMLLSGMVTGQYVEETMADGTQASAFRVTLAKHLLNPSKA